MFRAGRAATTDRPGDLPTEPVRWLVSLGLACVLAAVVLAIATNSLSGASPLLGRIKSRIVSPIFVPAWLDLGYDYRITYGLDEDADHGIEVRDRASTRPPLLMPGDRTGERAARWRRLARTIAVGGLEEDGSVVAAGVARGGFAGIGTDDVEVRVLRTPQPDRSAPAAAETEEVSVARVRLVGAEVQLIRDVPSGELAPLIKPSAPVEPGETP